MKQRENRDREIITVGCKKRRKGKTAPSNFPKRVKTATSNSPKGGESKDAYDVTSTLLGN